MSHTVHHSFKTKIGTRAKRAKRAAEKKLQRGLTLEPRLQKVYANACSVMDEQTQEWTTARHWQTHRRHARLSPAKQRRLRHKAQQGPTGKNGRAQETVRPNEAVQKPTTAAPAQNQPRRKKARRVKYFQQDGWRWKRLPNGHEVLCDEPVAQPTPPKIVIVVGICPAHGRSGNCLTCDGCASGMRDLMPAVPGISQSGRVQDELVTLGLVPLAISANGHPCALGHPSEQRC